jgi:hypothetical protein
MTMDPDATQGSGMGAPDTTIKSALGLAVAVTVMVLPELVKYAMECAGINAVAVASSLVEMRADKHPFQ